MHCTTRAVTLATLALGLAACAGTGGTGQQNANRQTAERVRGFAPELDQSQLTGADYAAIRAILSSSDERPWRREEDVRAYIRANSP